MIKFWASYTLITVDDKNRDLAFNYIWQCDRRGRAFAKINGKTTYIHQLIAERMGMADHEDRNPSNNLEENLRPATKNQNMHNRIGKSNRILPKGVYAHGDKFQASININGERIHLKTWNTIEEAEKAYQEAAIKYHREFACFG